MQNRLISLFRCFVFVCERARAQLLLLLLLHLRAFIIRLSVRPCLYCMHVFVCDCPVYFCEVSFILSMHRTIVSSSLYRFRINSLAFYPFLFASSSTSFLRLILFNANACTKTIYWRIVALVY